MKTKNLAALLSLFFCTICFVSCDNDDNKLLPITLEYENPQVKFDNQAHCFWLTPYSAETIPLFIKGGDGNYKVTNRNEEVVQLKYDGEKISLKAQSLGDTHITIEDGSHNVYLLSVIVRYHERAYSANIVIPLVKGDKMTAEDKKKLGGEIAGSHSIDTYKFTYKNADNSKGTVRLSCLEGNAEEQEYNFEEEHIQLTKEDAILIKGTYKLDEYNHITIKDDNGNVVDDFYITKNFSFLLKPETRLNSKPMPTYCLIRDLTKQYKENYPEMENAYLIQVIS